MPLLSEVTQPPHACAWHRLTTCMRTDDCNTPSACTWMKAEGESNAFEGFPRARGQSRSLTVHTAGISLMYVDVAAKTHCAKMTGTIHAGQLLPRFSFSTCSSAAAGGLNRVSLPRLSDANLLVRSCVCDGSFCLMPRRTTAQRGGPFRSRRNFRVCGEVTPRGGSKQRGGRGVKIN